MLPERCKCYFTKYSFLTKKKKKTRRLQENKKIFKAAPSSLSQKACTRNCLDFPTKRKI